MRKQDFIIAIAYLLIGLIIFINSIQNNFVFDDRPVISENNLIRDLRNTPKIFTTGYWYGGLGEDLGLYRPLTIFSYALNYRFHYLDVVGYHLTNIILHILATFLIYLVMIELFNNFMLAVLTSLFFLTHPIHTEAVTGLVGRAELLSALFFFLSYLFFIKIRKLENVESVSISHAVGAGSPRPYSFHNDEIPNQVPNDIKQVQKKRKFSTFYIIFLCSYFLGLLSKENCLSLIFIIPITDFIIFCGASLKDFLIKIKKYIIIYCGYIATTLIYLIVRSIVLRSIFPKIPVDFLDNQLVNESYFWRIIFAIRILFKYIYLLIFPLTLSPDYSYNQIQFLHSLIQLDNLIPLILLIIITLFIIFTLKRIITINFAILFFFFTILLTSNLLFPIGTIMGERLLYLPSFGFCLLLGYILNPDTYKKSIPNQNTPNSKDSKSKIDDSKPSGFIHFNYQFSVVGYSLLIFAVIIILFYSIRTYLRNPDWYDDYTLYSSAVKSSPNSSKVHGNLGEVYRQWGVTYSSKKYYSMAIEELNIALRIYSDNAYALNSLGVTYSILEDYDKALKYLEKSYSLKPRTDVLFNMGELYYNKGDYKKSAEYFTKTLQINPNDSIAKIRLKMALEKGMLQ